MPPLRLDERLIRMTASINYYASQRCFDDSYIRRDFYRHRQAMDAVDAPCQGHIYFAPHTLMV